MGKGWKTLRHKCFVCNKWFTSAQQLHAHVIGKPHAKLVATLAPFAAAVAEAAAAEYSRPRPPPPAPPPVEVLFRDEHLMAVNKPAGVVVHRSALAGSEKDSVLDRLRAQFPELAGALRPCHRLDRRTSGVVLFALSAECARRMAYMFMNKTAGVAEAATDAAAAVAAEETVAAGGDAAASAAAAAAARAAAPPARLRKLYVCLVRGFIDEDEGQVDRPLKQSRLEDREHYKTGPVKDARTRWWRIGQTEVPLQKSPDRMNNIMYDSARLSVVLAEPLTGRFHQIRRHLAHPSVSHPLIGDKQHGDVHVTRALAYTLRQRQLKAAAASSGGGCSGGGGVGETEACAQVGAPPAAAAPADPFAAAVAAAIAEARETSGQDAEDEEEEDPDDAANAIKLQLHACSLEFVHPMLARAPDGKLVPLAAPEPPASATRGRRAAARSRATAARGAGVAGGAGKGKGDADAPSPQPAPAATGAAADVAATPATTAAGGTVATKGEGGAVRVAPTAAAASVLAAAATPAATAAPARGAPTPYRVRVTAPLEGHMRELFRDVGIDPDGLDFTAGGRVLTSSPASTTGAGVSLAAAGGGP